MSEIYVTAHVWKFSFFKNLLSFDDDGNGFIEAHELKAKLSEMSGEQVTDEEVQDMIRQVDMDGDGKINFEEFVKLMQEH